MVTLQNLLEEISAFIEKHGLAQPDTFAGEQQAGIQQALTRVIEITISSLSELAEQPSGREVVWETARETSANSTAEAGGGSNKILPQQNADLVKSVLDDRYHGTVNTIAKAAKVKISSVSQLIDIVTAAAFEVLGKLATDNRWNAEQLGDWLRPNRPATAYAAPVPTGFTPPVSAPVPATPVGTTSWVARHASSLLVAVSVVALAELGYILSTRSSADATETYTAASTSTPEPAPANDLGAAAMPVSNISTTSAANPAAAPRKSAVPVVLKLKNGLRQIIGANSTESKLYQFLIDPAIQVDAVDPTKGWIGFDRIYFETNKATLTNESLWQLSNIASILKRFPAAKIKIGGYTDSTGNAINNLRLSKSRAEAAKSSLVSLGVDASHLTAVGYGVLDNIATNKTEEGRSLNRRVSLQVTQK